MWRNVQITSRTFTIFLSKLYDVDTNSLMNWISPHSAATHDVPGAIRIKPDNFFFRRWKLDSLNCLNETPSFMCSDKLINSIRCFLLNISYIWSKDTYQSMLKEQSVNKFPLFLFRCLAKMIAIQQYYIYVVVMYVLRLGFSSDHFNTTNKMIQCLNLESKIPKWRLQTCEPLFYF